MAAARLQNESYLNWIRGSLGLLILKEGLEEFVNRRVKYFHDELHRTVPQPYSRNGPVLQAQSQQQSPPCIQICKSCTNKDIQRHNHTWRVRCSSGVCREWLKHIMKMHLHQPNPNIACANLKPQLWPLLPWEVAKFYLPLGCEDVSAAKDADVAAILKLLSTCIFMSNFIKDASLVEEVLDIRNALMHSNTLAVSDEQLQHDTDKIIQLLKNLDDLSPTEKQTIERTIESITELQSKTMDVTQNREIIALKSKMHAHNRELTNLSDKCRDYDKTRQDLTTTSTELKTLNEEYQRTKAEITQLQESKDRFEEFLEANDLQDDISRLSTQIQNVQRQLSTQRQEVDTQLSMQRQEVDTQFKEHGERFHQLGSKVDTLEEQMKTKADISVASSSSTWEKQCKDLQQVLIDHYKTTCLIVQNPAENNDIGLEYLCVEPTIRVLRQSKGRDGLKNVNEEATSLSCRNIFFNEEYRSRQIYITGEAGSGKSMMCKTLVRLWCEAHGAFLSNESEESESDSEDSESDSEDEAFRMLPLNRREQRRQARKQRHEERKVRNRENREILSHFTLLFYITLRDSLSEYNVSEMIHSQILKYHASVKCLSASDVLSNECCLIIVDGLDEWVCPSGAPVPHFLNPGIPGRDIFNKTNVFVTTSRPWKFDILQLKSSEVDKHVELCALDEQSASQICSKVVKLLNKSQAFRKTKSEFHRTLEQKGLGHFKTIPVILIQLICLWFDNQELGKSQVQLYCSMLDLLLNKSQKNLCVQTTNTPTRVASETPLPKCITSHSHCQNHRQLIYCLSRVAFEALFDKTKENSLVFKSSQLEIYGVEQESIDMCLKSGILSQNKVLEKCSVSEKKISFLHKKFQEFLAAIFLASCDNIQDVVKHITDFCSTLDTCLEMSQVWLFVSGIRPDITRQLLDHLTRVVSADTKVKHYRQTLDGEGLIRDIQTCVTDCVIEGDNNGHSYDNIMLEDFYIDSNTACHVERLLSCTPRSKVKSVYIYTGGIGESQLTSITGQLEDCKSVQKLYLSDLPSRIDVSTVTQIVNNNLNTLTCLNLYSYLTATGELVSDICSISSKCLMALSLYVSLTHEHIEQILTRLPHSPTIRQLHLRLDCTDHGYTQCRPRIDLSTMTHIHTLVLWYMSVDNLQSVSDCVEHISLGYVILPVTTLCEFARRLSQTRRHVQVHLDSVTVTGVRESRVDVKTFLLHTCHGLKETHCQYNSDNTWIILFTTSSQ